jgi:hypothetical protein
VPPKKAADIPTDDFVLKARKEDATSAQVSICSQITVLLKEEDKPGVVVHTCNSSTWETKVGL